jgi:hypothetical protein
MPPPKFRCLTDAEAIPQIPQGPDAGNKWAQLERSRAETSARVEVLRDGNGNTWPERVYQVSGGSDLVGDHLVGMRPGNVLANAFRAGFVRREALLFEWR